MVAWLTHRPSSTFDSTQSHILFQKIFLQGTVRTQANICSWISLSLFKHSFVFDQIRNQKSFVFWSKSPICLAIVWKSPHRLFIDYVFLSLFFPQAINCLFPYAAEKEPARRRCIEIIENLNSRSNTNKFNLNSLFICRYS